MIVSEYFSFCDACRFYLSAYSWHDLKDQDGSVTVTASCSNIIDLQDKNETMDERYAKFSFSSSYEIPILDSTSTEYASWSEEIWYGPAPPSDKSSNTRPRRPFGESSLCLFIPLILCSALLFAALLVIFRLGHCKPF